MPQEFNPENFARFFGEKQDGDSLIRLRLSSGIGVNKALEVQLEEGVIMFATFLESLTCNLEIRLEKKTFESIWGQYGEMVEIFARDLFFRGRDEFRKLFVSPFKYLESILLNFKLASWRSLPELIKEQARGGSHLKNIVEQMLQREDINRAFRFFANLTENSFSAHIFLNDSTFLEAHVMTPGFLAFITGETATAITKDLETVKTDLEEQ